MDRKIFKPQMLVFSKTWIKCIFGVYILFIGFIFQLTFVMKTSAQSDNFENRWPTVQDYYTTMAEEYNVVGGALLFLDKGEVKGEIMHGLANISEGRQVDKETIFHWASITKTFTAVAIMQLYEDGLLGLEDPLTDYLPELRKIHNPFGSMDEITVRMALNHSTGLRNSSWPWGGNQDWHPFEPTTWTQLAAMFPYSSIEFEPGSAYSYSNPAIIFLGMIVEQLSGDPYEVYIDKNILKPLGMTHSYFNHTPRHLLPYRSNSYTLNDDGAAARGLDFHTGITTSNGGLNAPLTDMIKYLNFLTGVPDSGFSILSRDSLEDLWKEQLTIEEKDGRKSSVGLSFFIEELGEGRLIGHTGTQHSFYSFFYIHPESQTAVISVTNSDREYRMNQFREDMIGFIFSNLFF